MDPYQSWSSGQTALTTGAAAVQSQLPFMFYLFLLVLFFLQHYFGYMIQSFSTNVEAVLVLRMNKDTELIFHFVRVIYS